MSTSSPDQASSDAEAGPGSGERHSADSSQSGIGERLYRVVWRWHFYAGMILAPVLFVMAATGALYIFKDELEEVIYPGVTYVRPSRNRSPYEQQIIAVRSALPNTTQMPLMQVFADPRRATSMAILAGKAQTVYVDPYRGHYLGAIDRGEFFDTVLSLHRTLFLDRKGRIMAELCTCWTIVLAVTGIYLWWPRRMNQLWGVWLPRLRQKPYVVARDLHALSGLYVAVIAIVIAVTGLPYSILWGRGYQYAAKKTEAYDMFSKSMECKSPPEAKSLPVDRIVEVARQQMPVHDLTVWFPRIPNGVFLVTASNNRGPQVNRMLFIDRATGEILEDRHTRQTKLFYQLGAWNYSLHVGSVWGLPTKILWLVTCLILMTLPFSGLWMWWERRPKGQLGLPSRVNTRRPRWLIITIIATSVLLPVLGISVIVVLIGDLLVTRLRKS